MVNITIIYKCDFVRIDAASIFVEIGQTKKEDPLFAHRATSEAVLRALPVVKY